MAARTGSKKKEPVRKTKQEIAACPMPVEELKKTFDLFDTDKGGNLCVSELKHACAELGVKCTDNSAKKVFKMLDADNSGAIDWEEFLNFFCTVSDPEQMKGLLAAHNQRFADYKFRVKTDPNFLKSFTVPPSIASAQVFRAHDNDVGGLAWITQGKFVSGSLDGSIMEWDGTSRAPNMPRPNKKTLLADRGIYCIDAIVGGRCALVGTGATDANLSLWSLEEDRILLNFAGHTKAVFCCSMSASQRQSASGGLVGDLLLHDIQTGQVVNQWSQCHDNMITSCNFSKNERMICTGSRDGHVKIFDLGQTGTATAVIEDASASDVVSCALWCSDFEVISCGGDYCIKRWDVRKPTASPLASYMGHTSKVTALTLSPDGAFVVSGAEDGSVRVWELDGEKRKAAILIPQLNAMDDQIEEMTKSLATKQDSIFEADDPRAAQQEVVELTQQLDSVKVLHLSMSAELEQTKDLDTVKACMDLNDHKGSVQCISWCDLGSGKAQVVSGGADQTIQLAELDTSAFR